MTSYNKTAILSYKMRGMMLDKLSRAEMLNRLQITRFVEPVVNEAYKVVEDRRWRSNADNAPHGQPWNVSFHASQFPGDNPMACPRQALYRMMDFAPMEPFQRRSRTVMEAGKAIEVDLVRTLHERGILISAGPDEETQTGFVYEKAWLTGSVDCVIKPVGWNKPLPIEIKTKYQKDIDLMKVGAKGPDPGHVSQIKVQLALVALEQALLWPELELVTHGYILYLSRDRPMDTAEFREVSLSRENGPILF